MEPPDMVQVPVVFVPNWFWLFAPQAQPVPSDLAAKPWLPCIPIAVTPVSPLTCTGVGLQGPPVNIALELQVVVALTPNRPPSFAPQARTVPSLLSARLLYPSAAMAVTPVRPLAWTGELLFLVP